MQTDTRLLKTLKTNEKIIFNLRSIYDSYGYSHYKMSKFEEYDLYSKNKDFLVSDGIITFTDTNGKLMALKPDVTLSIIKNTKDSKNSVQKLFYNENVYRVSKGTHTFKEIMQVGLECIGKIDDFCLYEVLSLAVKSLQSISDCCILDVSHLGILSQVIDYVGIPEDEKSEIFKFISEKNLHEISKKCNLFGISDDKTSLLKDLISIHGSPDVVFNKVSDLLMDKVCSDTFDKFRRIIESLNSEIINIDFSVVDDINYYNGIVFKGFIENVPSSVLSGGQYDTMMKKMKRADDAIGFAVYLDMLDLLNRSGKKFDVDAVLLYNETTSLENIEKITQRMRENDETVLVLKEIPEDLRYKKSLKIENGEVITIENNA